MKILARRHLALSNQIRLIKLSCNGQSTEYLINYATKDFQEQFGFDIPANFKRIEIDQLQRFFNAIHH